YLGEFETVFPREKLHFNLKRIPDKADIIQRDRLKDLALVADESSSSVRNGQARDNSHVATCKIREQDPPNGPIHDIYAGCITRSDRHIRSIAVAGIVHSHQILRVM